MTTSYVAREDRLRLSAMETGGPRLVLWLTQRAAKLSASNTVTSIGAIVLAAHSRHSLSASRRPSPAEVQLASSEAGAGLGMRGR